MLDCCIDTPHLGCFDSCDSIDLGYGAVLNGTHCIMAYSSNDTWYGHNVSLEAEDEFIIPANFLNEANTIKIKIKQPDGSFYSFDGSNCITLTTEIVFCS